MPTTSVNSILVDPSDKTKYTFSGAEWATAEGGGVTVTTITLTPSGTVTVTNESAVASNAKTCIFTASASGSITAKFVMSDGQERERTLTIKVSNL